MMLNDDVIRMSPVMMEWIRFYARELRRLGYDGLSLVDQYNMAMTLEAENGQE